MATKDRQAPGPQRRLSDSDDAHSIRQVKRRKSTPWLLRAAELIDASPCPTPTKPLFRFEMTREAAEHNWTILESFDLDLSRAIDAQRDSPVGYGSEFRHPDVLDKLLFKHPRWDQFKQILLNGSDFQLDPLPVEMQQADLKEALERGNHKSARDRPEKLKELVLDDV